MLLQFTALKFKCCAPAKCILLPKDDIAVGSVEVLRVLPKALHTRTKEKLWSGLFFLPSPWYWVHSHHGRCRVKHSKHVFLLHRPDHWLVQTGTVRLSSVQLRQSTVAEGLACSVLKRNRKHSTNWHVPVRSIEDSVAGRRRQSNVAAVISVSKI